jgi:ATP-dependent DNA ligase
VVKRAREVTLFSRHKKVLNRRFPGVVEAIASLEGDFVLDGELVALDPQGRLPFRFFKTTCLGPFLSISTASTC